MPRENPEPGARGSALLLANRGLRFHLKVDTGMGRLGVGDEQLGRVTARVRGLEQASGMELMEGLYTQLASAGSTDARSRRHEP